MDIESVSGFADVANVFRSQSRKSDIVGITGESRLAILAPDTDAEGAICADTLSDSAACMKVAPSDKLR